MMHFKHISTNGKLNKARLARFIAIWLCKTSDIGDVFEDTKGVSESVNRRRTDNTMAKRKKIKGTNNDQQNIHIKLKIE